MIDLEERRLKQSYNEIQTIMLYNTMLNSLASKNMVLTVDDKGYHITRDGELVEEFDSLFKVIKFDFNFNFVESPFGNITVKTETTPGTEENHGNMEITENGISFEEYVTEVCDETGQLVDVISDSDFNIQSDTIPCKNYSEVTFSKYAFEDNLQEKIDEFKKILEGQGCVDIEVFEDGDDYIRIRGLLSGSKS